MSDKVLDNYHYDAQFRRYIVQFAAIFAGIQVEVGRRDAIEPHLVNVPIKNASADRVVSHIIADNTQNKLIRLPLMAFQLVNVALAPELRKGIGVERRNTFMPSGGLFPDDIKVVKQRQPIPYRATFELTIFASNQDQNYQITEQILTLFDPILQIQTTDDVFDWTRITTVEMTDIALNETVPAGTANRIIQTRMGFALPVYLSAPAIVNQNYIKNINLRIGTVSSDLASSFDVISDLDSQGIEYNRIFSLDDVDIT